MSTTLAQGGPEPARGLSAIPAFLSLVRFAHTIFALPFALAGALLARMEWPSATRLGWILLAMVGARSLAMALNRLIDHEIDARNPRTAARELPAGRLTRGQVWAFSAASLGALLLAVSQLPRLTWWLWPIPVALFALYPYAKRVTWACHLVLGITIGIAPLGAWIAVTGSFAWAPTFLGLAVACWIAGFDVIYALLDVDFDRRSAIRSIPATFGPAGALWATRLLHVAAVGFLVLAGLLIDAHWPYFAGVGLCALVLLVENVLVRPDRPERIGVAFGQANMIMSVLFAAAVVGEVALR